MAKAELPYVTLEYKEPIVYVHFKKAITLDEKEVIEMVEMRSRLVNYKPHLVLTTFHEVVNFTDEARKMAVIAQNNSLNLAHAVVVKYMGQRLVTSTYKEIEKPTYPLAIFTDEEEAEKWLLTFACDNKTKTVSP